MFLWVFVSSLVFGVGLWLAGLLSPGGLPASGGWHTPTVEAAASMEPSRGKLLDAPFIDQREKYPTGCESVTAVMALQYYGEELTVDTFIDDYLPMGNAPYVDEEGVMRGADPRVAFPGNPYTDGGWGCYATVIEEALEDYCQDRYTVTRLSGVPLELLCREYLDQGIPVLLWSTIDMEPAQESDVWLTDETGEEFAWIYPMHCSLLVGYDDSSYYFNDPLQGKAVPYGREETNAAYQALSRQAIVLRKNP